MVGQVLLDLADADVHPAANDDVFGPARDSHVSVVGHLPEISRLGEAVLGEKGRGFFGIREVFNHVGGAAVGDVALGTARHFVPLSSTILTSEPGIVLPSDVRACDTSSVTEHVVVTRFSLRP